MKIQDNIFTALGENKDILERTWNTSITKKVINETSSKLKSSAYQKLHFRKIKRQKENYIHAHKYVSKEQLKNFNNLIIKL